MIAFPDFWRERFGETPPLSYVLREAFTDQWVRFHALPDSRRYPESNTDRAEWLRRANTLAIATLGPNAMCWLVQLGSAELGWPPEAETFRDRHKLTLVADYVHDAATWPAFAATVTFGSGAFDELLLEVAQDLAFRTLWISADTGRVFAPYDGGFDIVLSSPTEVAAFKAGYSSWLPQSPSGL